MGSEMCIRDSFLTYAIIYVALVLCLYSGAVYLYNTFVAPKRK